VTTNPSDAPPVVINPPFAVTPAEAAQEAGPLNLLAIVLTVMLCLSWGLNQVAIKLALPEVPPLTQATIRAVGATLLLVLWMAFRRIAFNLRDGTLKPGLLIGLLFAFQFVLIYQGLLYTSASRSVVYLYTAPIFVVIGSRLLLPGERFTVLQWVGIVLSFSGMIVAFGESSPFAKPEQALGNAMMVLAAICTAGTTIVAKGSTLGRAPFEKTLLYQLAVSIPVSAFCACTLGEDLATLAAVPSGLAIGSLAFQTAWVAVITYLVWYALLQRNSANRLAAVTFLTPLFGVAAGNLILHEPLTPSFLVAVTMVTLGALMPRIPEIWALFRARLPRRTG
jgi:drug/metabolite transporter (DMT)-like permease